MLQGSLWESDPEAWLGIQDADPHPLRPYQQATVDRHAEYLAAGRRCPIIALPTGGGKTRVAAELIRHEAQQGRPTLFLAPRRELVYQASRALSSCGVQHGVVMAGREDLEDKWASCQVCSLDTLQARRRRGSLALSQHFAQVIVDECHLSITAKRVELLEAYRHAYVTGLSATPSRQDGRALGVVYDTIIEEATTRTLTDQGYLCQARYFSLSEPDLKRVKIQAGEYNQKQLAEVMNTGELVGDIVEHWLRLASDRRTVVFATSIAHSAALAEEFNKHGIAAEHVDANTATLEREAVFARFSQGRTQVLCNCFLAAYGFDLPELDCVVLARPTRSLVLYLQSVGRGFRIADGKEDCLVLDHAGSVRRFGFPTEVRRWSLNGKGNWGGQIKDGRGELSRVIKCPECRACFPPGPKCPECGYMPKPTARKVNTIDGRLVELKQGKTAKPDFGADLTEQRRFYRELKGFAKERGYKPGWPWFKFKERYKGKEPPFAWKADPPLAPTPATRGWIKSRQIAWAKRATGRGR